MDRLDYIAKQQGRLTVTGAPQGYDAYMAAEAARRRGGPVVFVTTDDGEADAAARAKLGTEYESLIGTVRNVGYKAVRPARGRSAAAESDLAEDMDDDPYDDDVDIAGGTDGSVVDALRHADIPATPADALRRT